jgi:hypothetical protein
MSGLPADEVTRNSTFSASSAAYPTTIGALLAEEWTIHPLSTLPSFLEFILMEEARRSGWFTLRSILETLAQQLALLGGGGGGGGARTQQPQQQQQQQQQTRASFTSSFNRNHETSEDRDDGIDGHGGISSSSSSSSSPPPSPLSWWSQRLVPWCSRQSRSIARFLAHSILRPYQAEILCVIVYALERASLTSPKSATVAEGIYGTKRVKMITIPESSIATTTTTPTSSTASASIVPDDHHNHHQDDSSFLAPSSNKLQPLSKYDAVRLALCVALGPYLSERMDQVYRRLVPIVRREQQQRRQHSSNQHRQPQYRIQHDRPTRWPLFPPPLLQGLHVLLRRPRLPKSFQQLFVMVYPWLHMSTHGIHLLYQIRYLLGKSFFFDPISHLLGLVVRRVVMEDESTPPPPEQQQQQQQQQHYYSSDIKTMVPTMPMGSTNDIAFTHTMVVAPARSRRRGGTLLLKQVAVAMVSSTLVVAFLARLFAEQTERHRQRHLRQTSAAARSTIASASSDTRNTADQRTASSTTTTPGATTISSTTTLLPPPPPPPPFLSSWKSQVSSFSFSTTTCPLCHQSRVHPTASTGGYVFCLKCLLRHVRECGTCPITGRPCPESKLVRLYEPRSSTSTRL